MNPDSKGCASVSAVTTIKYTSKNLLLTSAGDDLEDSVSPAVASGRDGDVVSLPVLCHLLATRDFRDVLKRQRQLLEGASGVLRVDE